MMSKTCSGRCLFFLALLLCSLATSAGAMDTPELQNLRRMLQQNPRDINLWNAYGIEQAKVDDVVGAIQTWRKALDLDPRYVHLYNNIGSALRRLGYLNESELWYRASLKIQSTYWTWYNLGLLLEEMKKFRESVLAFDEALKLYPSFSLAGHHKVRVQEFLARNEAGLAKPVLPLAPVSPPLAIARSAPTRWDDSAMKPEVSPRVEAPERPAKVIVSPRLKPAPVPAQEPPLGNNAAVFFTFDGGAEADGIPGILAALAEHHVRATFFLTGKWVESYPDLAVQILAAGHEIANHSMHHKDMSHWGKDAIAKDLADTEAVFQRVLGRPGIRYFRFPFGEQNHQVEKIVGELGYFPVYWDIDTLDWKEPSVESIITKVRSKLRPNSVILMHCGSKNGSKALPQVLDLVMQRGYKPIPLSTLDPNQIAAIPSSR